MTDYVITVPGTFVHGITDAQRSEIERRLRPQDPANTGFGENEELSLLTVQDANTFAVRLEVEAATRGEAEASAVRLVSAALRDSGFAEDDAPLGPAAVTGIDREF
ncbi:hypothetical protein A8W25_23840 [Streptomyces sp. ERV7]|uniref:hypothetical protein n=1 Tax=Streptomyces sp. ERV7 TaxID=1322334 RepID=UPI0007F3580C|nr:hypothetical protein [Streptomyces sp. ERV7]OAR22641.1 hypothetical protein A8W25_23840 [Streptomyces sp. ERV7]